MKLHHVWIAVAVVVVAAFFLAGGPERAAQAVRSLVGGDDVDHLVDVVKVYEGEYDFLYRDSRGYVTTGIGQLCKSADDAVKLDWRYAGGKAPAALVRSDHARVLAAATGHRESYYEALTQVRLPPGGARDLARTRISRDFLPGLRKLFPQWSSIPESAQSALLDLAYNGGLGGLGKLVTLVAAVNRGDYGAASRAPYYATSRESRNDWRSAQFAAAAKGVA